MSTVLSDLRHLPTTRLAILRTMGLLHTEPLQYDLECLRSIISDLAPDLVCAEITREDWENVRLSATTLEVREVLTPVIAVTDTVLVPVAPSSMQFRDYKASSGWRQSLTHKFDRILKWGQRKADRPETIHDLMFRTFCHTVCIMTEMSWSKEDRTAWKIHNEALAENILEAIRRDPGMRVLVVVQCQWYHSLEPLLKKEDWLEIVDYREL